jgi:YesN/AraC family two-component response regulator
MLKVFIADDSVLIRDRLRELITERSGLEVVGEAGDTRQAITSIHKLNPDVILLDIRMPYLAGGLSVLRSLETRDPTQVVIILTSFASQEYRELYLDEGANYFFDKTRDIPQMTCVLDKLALEKHGGASNDSSG